MIAIPVITIVTLTAAAAAVSSDQYSGALEPIRLPSWVHTKELRIWGYAA